MKYPTGTLSIFNAFALYNIGLGSLYAMLTLFLEHGLHFTHSHAYYLWGTFFALLFCSSLLGGYFGGVFGHHRAIVIGLVTASLGLFLMAFTSNSTLYIGLACFVTGGGLFTPNGLFCLGQLFKQDPRRDSAFTFCFIWANIGVFCAAFLNGFISHYIGYSATFIIAACSTFLAALLFLLTHKQHIAWRKFATGYLFATTALTLLSCFFILTTIRLSDEILMAICGLAFIILLSQIVRLPRLVCIKFLGCLALMFSSMAFWILLSLSPSVLTFFVEHHVNRHFAHFTIPTAVYYSLSPIFILILAPFFSYLWSRLDKTNHAPSIATKLSIGVVFMGLGYWILVPGIHYATRGTLASIWIVCSYAFQTMGEIVTAPVTQSMIGNMVPKAYESLMQGFRDCVVGISGIVAGFLAQTTITPHTTRITRHISPLFMRSFMWYGGSVFVIGCIIYAAGKIVKTNIAHISHESLG